MRVLRAFGILAVLVAMHLSAVAAEPWEPGGSLDTCLTAATRERQGVVTAWRQAGGGEKPPYVVSVLNVDGRIAEALCDPASLSNLEFKERAGLFRYEMYQKAKVSEPEARPGAPAIFAGPVRIFQMEYTVSITGKPYYTYQIFLPSGHKATVAIDAGTGRMTKATVE
jgi:hypothetical protein